MRVNRLRLCSLFVLLCMCLASPVYSADSDTYLKKIKPLLKTKCFSCHGALKQNSDFRADTAKFLQRGGESGAGFERGKAEGSLLMGVLTGDAGFKMPPEDSGKALTADELKLIRDWINSGAKAPHDEKAETDPRQYWSYQQPKKSAVPQVRNKKWGRNEIDAFLAAEHEKQGLVPRPPAAPAVLLRRLYLDLIGLPPTRKELDSFLSDPSDTAYAKHVDKLLNSKQYGERWGRHWMDVWRYSDWYGSRGINQIRYSQRHIWRWRDWIVESVNSDKPYDQMIVEMLAGDELEPTNADVVRATGFLGRNWYKFDRNVWLYETVEQTSVAFLGLTMKCARCHDHKYDPIDQVDYYRFRAFFEPHNVRTDAISAQTKTQKDTGEDVLTEGIARVFDKELEVPTFLFRRGDDRQPDKETPLAPGVPPTLSKTEIKVTPVSLPLDSYYPAMQPKFLKEGLALAKTNIQTAQKELENSQQTITSIETKLTAFKNAKPNQAIQSNPAIKQQAYLSDNFQKMNPKLWKPVSGKWEFKEGSLTQSQVGSFRTMVSKVDLPLNFQGRIRYKTLQPGSVHSVGLYFDTINLLDAQAIYTAINNKTKKASIQAFHRQGGRDSYPKAGIFKCDIKLNEEVILDFVVRGQELNVWVNGELKIVYTMPITRKVGKFALWNHSATAQYSELRIEKIQPGFQLAKSLTEIKRSPFEPPSKEVLEQELAVANADFQVAQQDLLCKKTELTAYQARVAAEQAKLKNAKTFDTLAKKASRLEREAAEKQAALEVRKAKRQIVAVQTSTTQVKKDKKPNKKMVEAKKKLTAAQKKLDAAKVAAKKEGKDYKPLGKVYPKNSTGRRLALARWIANKKNPRTARVAINHIWLRHFNKALVPTVSNFGLNGKAPSHPELLDWLSVTFMEQGWKMKPMHRLMVLSSAYRMSTANGESESNLATDPDNKYLWRMNSRRMEAEVVRDCLLATAGTLDNKMGGPELEEKQGETNHRRSLYFRITPNEKMEFLELFDLASPNACYERLVSVVPQQALALTNSSLALDQARILAEKITSETGTNSDKATESAFIQATFKQVLSRSATDAELKTCLKFLKQHTELLKQKGNQAFPGGGTSRRPPSSDIHQRARENLVHVLYSHNDFVTVR